MRAKESHLTSHPLQIQNAFSSLGFLIPWQGRLDIVDGSPVLRLLCRVLFTNLPGTIRPKVDTIMMMRSENCKEAPVRKKHHLSRMDSRIERFHKYLVADDAKNANNRLETSRYMTKTHAVF